MLTTNVYTNTRKGRPKTLLTDSQRVVGRHTNLPPSPLVERAGVEPASSAHAKGSKPLCSFTPPPQRNFVWDIVQVDHRLEAHPRAGRRTDAKPSPIQVLMMSDT